MIFFKKKIDLKTLIYLYITGANIVPHIEVVDVERKENILINKNDVYIFKDYEEYKNFFFMYLDEIDEKIIDLAIYTKGKKGQIIALKGLCEHIILKIKVSQLLEHDNINSKFENSIKGNNKLALKK